MENENSKFFCNEKNISCPFQNALRHVGYIFVIITIKLRCQYQIHFFIFSYAMSDLNSLRMLFTNGVQLSF